MLAIQMFQRATDIEWSRDAIATCLHKGAVSGYWLDHSQKDELVGVWQRLNEALPQDMQQSEMPVKM